MRMKYLLLAAIAVVLSTSSCSTKRTPLTYFQDIQHTPDSTLTRPGFSLKIVPDDELYITIMSNRPEATAMYNLPASNPATRDAITQYSNPRQLTYIVDKNGNINIPSIGEIHVEGLTTAQLAELIKRKVETNVSNPVVRVELLNFRVNVLGEVKRPGAIKVSTERYSILDALADAGDLTQYGERGNVLLIREENGKTIYHTFNLNDASTLSSPYFYLKQNDAIYVEPNNILKDNSKYNQNNAFKVSVVSAIVSACSVVASLVIALTIK